MAGSGPRRPHPPPSQPPAVARVTPLVPEVSLFLAGGSGGGAPARFGGWNNNEQTKGSTWPPVMSQHVPVPGVHSAPGSGQIAARPPPPAPHEPLLQGIPRATPDFSRLFDNSLSLHESSGGNLNCLPRSQAVESFSSRGQERPTNPAIYFTDRVEVLATRVPAPQEETRSMQFPPYSTNPPHRDFADSFGPRTDHPASNGLSVPAVTPPKRPVGTGTGSAEDSPSVPPEILRVLNWQNEQLKLLQEQVRLLLDSSPHLHRSDSQQQTQQGQGLEQTKQGLHQQPQGQPQRQQGQHYQQQQPQQDIQPQQYLSGEARTMSSVGTNTSSLWPEIQQGLARLHQIVEQEEEEEEDSNSYEEVNKENIPVDQSATLRSPPLSMHLDLPDYAGSECSPDLRQQQQQARSANGGRSVSWESPVLGESVSMYEEQQLQQPQEGEEVVVQDILSQVRRLLADPPPPPVSVAVALEPSRLPPSPPSVADVEQPDPAAATLARLRQLGVSFISPEDLCLRGNETYPGGSAPTTNQPLLPHPYNSIFLPRAVGLSQPSLWSANDSPDCSLEINSLALKYLDDAQLSRLAEQHRVNRKTTNENRPIGKVSADRSDVNLSLATQEFLQRHGLADAEGGTGRRAPLRAVNVCDGAAITTPPTGGDRQLLSRRPRLEQQLAARQLPPPVNQVMTGGRLDQIPIRGSPLAAARTQPPPPPQPEISNRILDITAIRQQPKLL